MADKSKSSITGAQTDDPAGDSPVDAIPAEDTQAEDTQAEDTAAGSVGADSVSGPCASKASPAEDSLAGSEGADGLTGGAADDVISESGDGGGSSSGAPVAASGGGSSGGGGRVLITMIILALIGVGLYTTYPVWRSHALPYAERFGIPLPQIPGEEPASETASAPPLETTETNEVEASASTSASTPASTPAPTPAPTPAAAPTPAPTLAPNPANDAAVEALTARLDGLAKDVAALSEMPSAPGPDASGDVADLKAEFDGLRAAVDETRSTLSTFGDELGILRDNLGNSEGGEGIGPFAAELSKKLSGFEARVAALESTETAPAVTPDDLAAVTAAVDALSLRLDQEVKATDTAQDAMSSRLDAIDTALDDLRGAVTQTRSRSEQAGAFLIASNQLALAASRSGSFEAELDAVAAVAGSSNEAVTAAVASLRGAFGGVASRSVLRDRFARVASEILDASVVGADDDLVGTALRNVAALVSIRRTTTSDGDSLNSLVTGAENAVRAGDLQAAVDALSSLEGDTASAAAGWLSEARDRLAVDQAVSVLQSAAIANLAGG